MVKCKGDINCKIVPSFNYKDEKTGIYCKTHKKEHMINVISKCCLEENCSKQPVYNLPNIKKGLYCYEHKKENMINVKGQKCLEENCNKQPTFNLLSEKKGLYCSEHKKENMFNVISRKCIEQNCNSLAPCFNYINENNGIYCAKHKKENMFDVKNKKCKFNNCDKIPVFNLLNTTNGLFCYEHKTKDMIDVVNKKCQFKNCNIQPRFNYKEYSYGLFCSNHKSNNMINVIDKLCKECKYTLANSYYKGFCFKCFITKFPNNKISRQYKIKENYFIEYIKKEFINEILVFDKNSGISKRRPDCFIDKILYKIIIECDEEQHKHISIEEENNRILDISNDFNNIPLIFIRFNPDSYKINNKKYKSSFIYNKNTNQTDIYDIKEWNGRLNKLKETILKWLTIFPNKNIIIEKLFYDIKK